MRLRNVSGVVLAGALALSACGGSANPQPTANSAATADAKPLATARPAATATKAPTATTAPTATKAPTAKPAISDAAGIIEQALKKIETDKSYAMEMSATLQGDLGAGAPAGIDPTKPFEFMGMVGSVNGKDSQFTMKGMVATLLGANAEKGIQFISSQGVTYVRGPMPALNAPEDKWYKLPTGDTTTNDFSSKDLVDSMAGSDLEKFKFAESGKEKIHGQSCTLYDGDKEATKQALQSSEDSGGLPTARDFGDLQDALMQFAVCDDGYVHRMIMSFTGTPESQEKPVTMVMTMNLSDFGKPVKIEVPADAEDIQKPGS